MEFAACGSEMIVKCAAKAGWARLGYAVYYRRNIRELRGKLDLLLDRQITVQHEIEEATRNGKMIEDEVKKWMDAVKEMTQRAQEMYENEIKERESRCPNPMSRYRLGRRATELARQVDTRFNQSFERISYPKPVQEMTDMSIIGESSEGFDSRVSIVNEIMEALRDPKVKRIGLCGIGGVGKTTTAKEVARKVKGEMFETVVMVQVTDHLDYQKIQREIAEKVDMKLNDETETVRATRLCERLKQEKNMLLILDDLWKELEFNKIGIPSDSRVLLTSRMDRLADQMECKKVIKVDVMSEDEAWKLFTKKIAELPDDNEIRSIAKEIVGHCGRLPVRIVAAAGTLKKKKIHEWRDVLQRLKSPLARNNTGIEEADGIFKVSYDRLSPESKPIFLLSAILSHNPSVKDLMMCSVGLDLLRDVNTMEGALVRIHSLIDELKASNLLLDSSHNSRFAIHDVIRDVALSIASGEETALVLGNKRLNRWLDKNVQKKCRSMWLDNCDINNLPEKLSCPNLQFFLLNNNNSDLTIPTTFFLSTNKLKVMGFTDMHFSCLPSLQSLQDELQTLCLHSCALEDISEVGNLKSLTILSLAHSRIKQLPLELSQLTSLQMLNLAFCSELEVIPPKLLSNLKRLEVLDMRNSFKQWETEGDNKENENASVDELKHLTNLSSLAIQIPDVFVLPKDLFKDIPLERYMIAIEEEYYGWWSHDYQTTLSIRGIYLDDGIQKLLENVEELCLNEVKGTAKVLCDLHGRKFLKLKSLKIQNNHRFDYVIRNSTGPVGSFFQLVKLVIEECKSMEAFVVSTQQDLVSNDVIVFHQLHTLQMSHLPRITTFYLEENATNNESKSLFNTKNHYSKHASVLAIHLALEYKWIANSKVSFPKLERMELQSLNRLIPSIWDDHQLPQNSFSNLKTLIVWYCGFVERLIPFHVLKSLCKLEELEVWDCESLEIVFDIEEVNNQEIQLSWFVPLRKLKLKGLPKLKHVWGNDSQEVELFHDKVVQNLKVLELDGEFAMMIWNAKFLPGNLFQSVEELSLKLDGSVSFAHGLHINRFPNLQKLKLSGSVKEKEVIPTLLLNERPQQAQNLQTLEFSWHDLINLEPFFLSFTNLIDIQVRHCFRLGSLMTPSTSRSLVQLTRLTISDCNGLEEIIRKQEGSEEKDDVENEIIFQKLESLTLRRLPRLRSFCGHNYTLRFPSLEEVIVDSGCERMSIFCAGDIHTPSLEGVEYGWTWTKTEYEKLVDKNLNTTIQHLSSQVSFPELMRLNDSNDLNLWIWDDQFSQNKFANLKTLVVWNCGFVERLIPFRVLKYLSNLEELEVYRCESLEMVFDIEEVNNYEKEIHQLPWVVPLKKLQLGRLPKLKHVWSNDPQEMVSFHSLQEVEARDCEELKSMFPASIAERGLLQLKKLTIQTCGIINAIVAKELYVSFCDELEMFQKQVSSTSILEDEGHDTYPPFFQEKVVDKLKRLDLDGKLAMMIWKGQFPEKLFHNVQELSLKLDRSAVSFAHGLCNDRLPNLQELNLYGWVKELLINVAPSKLTKLVLRDVKGLKHIWNQQSQKNSLLQNIQTLEVFSCGDLINLGPSFLSFANLTDIQVSYCDKLSSLITPSTSRSLVQLTRLTIYYCNKIEEIIRKQEGSEEEDDVENEIVFQKLESLTLRSLRMLRSFCGHNYTLRFPSLQKVIIEGCERMSMFCAGDIHTPSLKSVQYGWREYEKLVDNNLNTTIQQSFPTKVTKLELHPEMRNIWMEKVSHHMSFSRLKHLIVDNCDFLSEYVIPTHLVRFLSNLKKLEVRNCLAIKTIFDLKGTNMDEETHKLVANIHLTELKLHNLPNLKSVWIQDFDGSTCFQHLEELYVGECERLRNIFVASVAKGLGQLKKLSIESCGVEEIIAKDEASKESPNFVFPQLNYLKLDKLPNLKCFYTKRCLFEWPQLTDLFVSQCGNVDVFGTEITSNIESDEEDEVETQLPLFFAEKVIPKLESVSLSQKDTVTFDRNGQFQSELFHEVKTLCLESFVGESIAFPYDFLRRFPNLNELNVNHSSFEEIFPSQVQHVDDMAEIAPFKTLRLAYLDQLKTIWNDDNVDSQLPPFPQNLESLEVECCCSLIKLTPSSASLENLTHLKVSGCHQLTYLLTNSTAKSLMDRLMKLKITDCTKMEEIITNENNDAEAGEITFNKLERLELTNLPILKSFCLKNQGFKFPELRSLTIRGCHQMKMFCHGVLETPRLGGLETEEGGTPLEGDLNKTIELLISDKDG